MKESKFIELLNLYVDHQISPSDAALLEAEIQRSPERRKVYRQYCQMQKACSTLAETFLADAPAPDKSVETASEPRRFALVTYAMGFAAAAACVALVIVNQPVAQKKAIAEDTIAASQLSVSSTNEDSVAVIPEPEPARAVLHPAFSAVGRRDPSAMNVVATDTTRLDWMKDVRVERVTAENLWFDPQPALQHQDLTLRSGQQLQGPVETTAFIFAK